MSMKKKLGIAVGALLISGGVLTGAALANEAPATADPAAQTQGVTKANPLSEAARELLTKIGEIRKSYMEKADTDAKALVDQAVADGKITREEADKLLHHGGKGFGPGMARVPLTQEELKAKLDELVKSGKLTQEHADKALTEGGKLMEHVKGSSMGRGGEKGRFFQDGEKHLFSKGDLKGNLQSKLDEAVKAGTITQEQATQLLEKFGAQAQANQ